MIYIQPSPTADTRTCDWSKVTKETLFASSIQHRADVAQALDFFAAKLREAALRHDQDKLSAIDHFHADFQTGFAQTGWWDNHRKVNRHHLTEADGIPPDVNLIDVLDFVVDCTVAGLARSGSVRPLTLDPAVLQRAFENTAALLLANVEVRTVTTPPTPAPAPREADADCALCNGDGILTRAFAEPHEIPCPTCCPPPATEAPRTECTCAAAAKLERVRGALRDVSVDWHNRHHDPAYAFDQCQERRCVDRLRALSDEEATP